MAAGAKRRCKPAGDSECRGNSAGSAGWNKHHRAPPWLGLNVPTYSQAGMTRQVGCAGPGRPRIVERMTLTHLHTIPILRSFDQAKAREFYVEWLGFTVDWEHRFEAWAPLYMQVSRAGIVFHISEHHGDGSPGSHVRVAITGVADFHAELIGKRYKNNRPGLERPEWGGTEFTVIDPVNNRITFAEADAT
jgi:catechol 2,3-dioxygenase-like lactoylglutathione lyase family enzyme